MFEIKIDNEVILTVSDTEEQIVKDSVPCFKEWVKQGFVDIVASKIPACMSRLDAEWIQGEKLAANGVTSIPTGRDARAALIFQQPNYKSRVDRDLVNTTTDVT